MKLEIWLFFESIAMILLFLTIIMNRRDTGRRIPWIIPMIATFIFGFMMFAPISTGGYVKIVNQNNASDVTEYNYEIASSQDYQTTIMINFIFFLISALITIYSAMMEPVREITERFKEIMG